MKNQVVFIYDPRTKKLINVCDVRSLTPEQFESFSLEAKKNLAEQIKKQDETWKEMEETYRKEQKETKEQIKALIKLVEHLLGLKDLELIEIDNLLAISEGEKHEEE